MSTAQAPRGVAEFLRGIDLSGLHLNDSSPDNANPSGPVDFSWCEELPRLQWIKLGRTGLSEIPAEIPKLPRLEHLTLNRNSINTIRPGLSHLKHLRVLNCRNNAIDNTGIPQKLFNNQELQVFDASHNALTVIPSNLVQATSLLVLNVSHNQLTSVPPELFTQCTELMFLDLSHNQLVEMPAQLRRLTKLQSLRLSSNPLRHAQLRALSALRELRVLALDATERRAESAFPADMGKLEKLQELNLADNALTRLPDVVFKLASLIKLDLSSNELTDLSSMVDCWPRLQYLNLSSNKLSNLPASLCRLVHLRKLYVNKNCLTFSGVPAGIGKLQDLTVFNASNNQLENIPEGLCRCGRLKKLILNDNCLITLPDAIHYLIETLDVFEVAGNSNLVLPPKPQELQRGAGLAYYNIDFSLENMMRQAAGGGKAAHRQDSTSSAKDTAARLRRLRSRRPQIGAGAGANLVSRYNNEDSGASSSRVLEGMRRVAREGRRERDLEAEQQAHQQEQARRWKQMLVRPELDYSRIFDEDVGNDEGVEIWEIDEFYPKHLDQEALHGTFYDGDCYIVLHTYREGPTSKTHHPDQLQWAIYYWIGQQASLDKRACAAMHAVNLRNLLGAECRTKREEQGDESEDFLLLMPTPGKIHVIEGTHGETGFLRVEETEPPTKLYRLYPDGQRMGVVSMPLAVKSLDPKYAYVLDSNVATFVWLGAESRTVAQTKARLLAEKLALERRKLMPPPPPANSSAVAAVASASVQLNDSTSSQEKSDGNTPAGSTIQVVAQQLESKLFWKALLSDLLDDEADLELDGKKHPFKSEIVDHIPLHWNPPVPVVFDVHLGKGYLELPQVPLGAGGFLRKELLQSKHVYIIRSGGEVFVWLGRQSPKFLRFAGMKLADECKKIMCIDWMRGGNVVTPSTPIVCTEGVESQIFRTQFRGWDDTIAVDFTRTAESVRKRGADVNTILERDKMKVDLKHIFIPRETQPSREDGLQIIQEANEDLVAYLDLCESADQESNGGCDDDSEPNNALPPPGSVKQVLKQLIMHGSKWSAVETRWKGHFFSQDCYLIIAEYWDTNDDDDTNKSTDGPSDEEPADNSKVSIVIYFWQGRDASDVCLHQFNLSLRKQLVEQLNSANGSNSSVSTRTFRQQQEDSTFLAHFERGFTIHYGRYDERYAGDVHDRAVEMFVLRSQGGCVLNSRCVQVTPSTQHLNSYFHCIVRAPAALLNALKQKNTKLQLKGTGDRVYIWLGSEAHPDEAGIITRIARENYEGLNDATIITVHEGQEDAIFWMALGGKRAYDTTADFLFQSRLFRLSNEQGYFTASEKCVDFCQDDLADDDVMMLDTGEQIYLWFGSRPSDVEKKLAPQAAKVYREHLARIQPQKPRQMRYTLKGQEPHLFRRCFHGWSKFREFLS